MRASGLQFGGLRRLWVALLLGGRLCRAYDSFDLYSVPLTQLQGRDESVGFNVLRAISEVGMFAVTLSDDQQLGGSKTLKELVRCVIHEEPSSGIREVSLDDGTKKQTVATSTNHSVASAFPAEVESLCHDFSTASSELRSTVDETGLAFSHLLDDLTATEGPLLSDGGPAPQYDSFYHTAHSAESLEHFHVFTRPAAAAEDEPTLHMHSDIGLFIVMTPAQYFQLDTLQPAALSSAGGFFLELPDGQVIEPRFPPNSLLVMGGEGSTAWIHRPCGDVPLRAPGHEVVLPEIAGLARAWYGRMYLPFRSAKLVKGPRVGLAAAGTTFGEFREQSRQAFHDGHPETATALSCHPARRTLADERSCGGDEIYCWMSCQAVRGDCDAAQAACQDTRGRRWPEEYTSPGGTFGHCNDCTPVCQASPPPPASPPLPEKAPIPALEEEEEPADVPVHREPAGDEICNGYFQATVMWMTGFQGLGDERMPCVALLFQDWVLNTRLKFQLACFGVLLASVAVEGIVWARRRISRSPPKLRTKAHVAAYKACMLAVYACQVALGYMLMLVAMTYQTELFAMVVVGLTVGHGIFNLNAPVMESAEACCTSDLGEGEGSGSAPRRHVEAAGGPPKKHEAGGEERRACCEAEGAAMLAPPVQEGTLGADIAIGVDVPATELDAEEPHSCCQTTIQPL